MTWNLVEALSKTGERRAFFLPLASRRPDTVETNVVTPDQFEIDDGVTLAGDPFFIVNIRTRQDENNHREVLCDAACRIHAMASGTLRFQPTDTAMNNRLILQMSIFSELIAVPWWQRWVEAKCVPNQVIYENVDTALLEETLQSMVPDQPHYGLRLPKEVVGVGQRAFIEEFLSGNKSFSLYAEAGAVIGVAARVAASTRLLRLHVRYKSDVPAEGRSMDPREFLYLLFGDDSEEATHHPLLLKMNATAVGRRGVDAKPMCLRPPLRTFGRIKWQAEQELNNHSARWSPANSLGVGRFCNTHKRGGRSFNNGDYTGFNKCNLFVSEMALRAGFRVPIHAVSQTVWHYLDSNSYCNLIHVTTGPGERIEARGCLEDASTGWAWKIENWMRAQPIADLQHRLNEALWRMGRCLILAGARARRFVETDCHGKPGFCNCGKSLRRHGIGHIVLVSEVLDRPVFAPRIGEGLLKIRVRTLEACGSGASSRVETFAVGKSPGNAAGATTDFLRLHLFELHPGGDPNTEHGLRDLNVRNPLTNLLGTRDEAAAQQRLTHYADGILRSDNACCRDLWPTSDSTIETLC